MHISLREWNGNTFSIETSFHVFCCVKVYIPVVLSLDPHLNHKIHAAVCKLLNGYHRSGILQDTIILLHNTLQNFPHLLKVIGVTYTNYIDPRVWCP